MKFELGVVVLLGSVSVLAAPALDGCDDVVSPLQEALGRAEQALRAAKQPQADGDANTGKLYQAAALSHLHRGPEAAPLIAAVPAEPGALLVALPWLAHELVVGARGLRGEEEQRASHAARAEPGASRRGPRPGKVSPAE